MGQNTVKKQAAAFETEACMVLLFHLFSKEAGCCLHQFFLNGAGGLFIFLAAENNGADGVSFTDNCADCLCLIVGAVVQSDFYKAFIVFCGNMVAGSSMIDSSC